LLVLFEKEFTKGNREQWAGDKLCASINKMVLCCAVLLALQTSLLCSA
jgi:hypothetical protein